jgi:hypothetical protein
MTYTLPSGVVLWKRNLPAVCFRGHAPGTATFAFDKTGTVVIVNVCPRCKELCR